MKKLTLIILLAALCHHAAHAKSRRGLLIKYRQDSVEIDVARGYWNGKKHIQLFNYSKGYFITCYQSGPIQLRYLDNEKMFTYVYNAVEVFTKDSVRTLNPVPVAVSIERLALYPHIYLSQLEWELLAKAIRVDAETENETRGHIPDFGFPSRLFFVCYPF